MVTTMFFKRNWKIQDLTEFARISGDYNPIHVDTVYARRSVFGKPVVHGIYLVLWALDQYCAQMKRGMQIRTLKVIFRRPLGINEEASLFTQDANGGVELTIKYQGIVLVNIFLEYDFKEFLPLTSNRFQHVFTVQEPEDIKSQELPGKSGEMDIQIDSNSCKDLFPSACQFVPMEELAVLVTTTRLVGMRCPGRNSVYNQLEIDFTKPVRGQEKLHYEVKNFHDVFHLASIQITSYLASGSIKAFVRPEFKEQGRTQEIKACIVTDEFKSQKALIIGGSRGLGALTARILAIGGAEVCITFAQGLDEALKLKDEMSSEGCWVHTARLDVVDEQQNVIDVLPAGWVPTHLYYFATPFIFEGSRKNFSQELFDRFCKFYVSGFWKVATQILSLQGLKFILYPSSSALNECPVHMLEYTAAKSAGEAMAAYVQKHYAGVKVICPRFERLATAQTVSLTAVDNKDPLPVLLELLRSKAMDHHQV